MRTKHNGPERHYLGIWHGNLCERSDIIACAWREEAFWKARMRFRYFDATPRESRYAHLLNSNAEKDVRSIVESGIRAANLFDMPITFTPIHGDHMQAVQKLRESKLFGRAMDKPEIPVAYDEVAGNLSSIFTRCFSLNCFDEFEAGLAKFCKLEPWTPNEISFWPLDIIFVRPKGPMTQFEDQRVKRITEKRQQWQSRASEIIRNTDTKPQD